MHAAVHAGIRVHDLSCFEQLFESPQITRDLLARFLSEKFGERRPGGPGRRLVN
jgi:hypothetical protein